VACEDLNIVSNQVFVLAVLVVITATIFVFVFVLVLVFAVVSISIFIFVVAIAVAAIDLVATGVTTFVVAYTDKLVRGCCTCCAFGFRNLSASHL
jgi:hypothetical protein